MQDGYTFYTENAGLPSLRRAIAENYRRLHGVELDPASEIVVTASGVQALNVGIRCVLDPGDEALVLTPAWPNGSSSVMMANAVVTADSAPAVRRPVRDRFRRARSGGHAAHAAAAVHVALESAGLGGDGEEQQALLDFARRHGLWLMADEVYDRLVLCAARGWASRCLRFCSRRRATTR